MAREIAWIALGQGWFTRRYTDAVKLGRLKYKLVADRGAIRLEPDERLFDIRGLMPTRHVAQRLTRWILGEAPSGRVARSVLVPEPSTGSKYHVFGGSGLRRAGVTSRYVGEALAHTTWWSLTGARSVYTVLNNGDVLRAERVHADTWRLGAFPKPPDESPLSATYWRLRDSDWSRIGSLGLDARTSVPRDLRRRPRTDVGRLYRDRTLLRLLLPVDTTPREFMLTLGSACFTSSGPRVARGDEFGVCGVQVHIDRVERQLVVCALFDDKVSVHLPPKGTPTIMMNG